MSSKRNTRSRKMTDPYRRCRVCATYGNPDTFLNIFDNPELELDVKIAKLLPIMIMPSDTMPHMICQDCVLTLEAFDKFYEASLRADKAWRTLHPSAPSAGVDPSVEVPQEQAATEARPVRLAKKRQATALALSKRKKVNPEGSVIPPKATAKPSIVKRKSPKMTLKNFIVSRITENEDCILTCRKCFRTFTNRSSAMSHSCAGAEEACEKAVSPPKENEEKDDETAKKSLRPLKIRLLYMKSGKHVCYLCDSEFHGKAEAIEHVKNHFVQSDSVEIRRDQEEEKEEQSETELSVNTGAKTRKISKTKTSSKKIPAKGKEKKTAEPQKKIETGRSVVSTVCTCAKCRFGQSSKDTDLPYKTTAEQSTQCSDVEIPDQDEVSPRMLTSLTEDPVNIYKTFGEAEQTSDLTSSENSSSAQNLDTDEPVEIPQTPESDTRTDDITVLEVIKKKARGSYSSCTLCEHKLLWTKQALIAHQSRHMQGCSGNKKSKKGNRFSEVSVSEVVVVNEASYLCSICPTMFTNERTLLKHEQSHVILRRRLK